MSCAVTQKELGISRKERRSPSGPPGRVAAVMVPRCPKYFLKSGRHGALWNMGEQGAISIFRPSILLARFQFPVYAFLRRHAHRERERDRERERERSKKVETFPVFGHQLQLGSQITLSYLYQ